MTNAETSLYERIGGQPTVDRLVNIFYARVLSDPRLEHFFERTPMDKLRTMQREFFAAALNGPLMRSDLELAHAHQGRGIKEKHFNRFVQHLLDTLEEVGVDEDDRYEIIRGISTYVGDITGDAGGAGE